jgi:hypothetical protein
VVRRTRFNADQAAVAWRHADQGVKLGFAAALARSLAADAAALVLRDFGRALELLAEAIHWEPVADPEGEQAAFRLALGSEYEVEPARQTIRDALESAIDHW